MDLIQRFQQSLTEYNRAKSLIGKGEIDQAESLLKNALSLYPREVLMQDDPDIDGVRESYETLFTDISVQLEVIKTLRSEGTGPEAPASAPPEPAAHGASFTSLQDIVKRNMQQGSTPPSTLDSSVIGTAGDDEEPAEQSGWGTSSAGEEEIDLDLPSEISDEEETVLIEETLKSDFDEAEHKRSEENETASDTDESPDLEMQLPELEPAEDEAGEPEITDDDIPGRENESPDEPDVQMEIEEQPGEDPAVELPDEQPVVEADEPQQEDDAESSAEDVLGGLLDDAENQLEEPADTAPDEELQSAGESEATETAEEQDEGGVEEVEQEPEKQEQESDGIEEMLDAAEEEVLGDEEVLEEDAAPPESAAPAPTPAPAGGDAVDEVLGDDEEILDDEEEALLPEEEIKKQKSPKKNKTKKKRKRSGAGAAAVGTVLLALFALAALGGGGYLMYDAYTKSMAREQAYVNAASAAESGKIGEAAKHAETYMKSIGESGSPLTGDVLTAAWSEKLKGDGNLDKADALLSGQLARNPSSKATAEQLLDILIEKLVTQVEAGDTAAADKAAMRISRILKGKVINPAKKITYIRILTSQCCIIKHKTAWSQIEAGDTSAAYDTLMQLEDLEKNMTDQERQDIAGIAAKIARALEEDAAAALKAGDAKTAAGLAAKVLELDPKSRSAAGIKKRAEAKLK